MKHLILVCIECLCYIFFSFSIPYWISFILFDASRDEKGKKGSIKMKMSHETDIPIPTNVLQSPCVCIIYTAYRQVCNKKLEIFLKLLPLRCRVYWMSLLGKESDSCLRCCPKYPLSVKYWLISTLIVGKKYTTGLKWI